MLTQQTYKIVKLICLSHKKLNIKTHTLSLPPYPHPDHNVDIWEICISDKGLLYPHRMLLTWAVCTLSEVATFLFLSEIGGGGEGVETSFM